jgi:hypothetical protein
MRGPYVQGLLVCIDPRNKITRGMADARSPIVLEISRPWSDQIRLATTQ